MRLLALVLVLNGCGGDILRVSGIEVAPPLGYSVYCAANPREKECGG